LLLLSSGSPLGASDPVVGGGRGIISLTEPSY
jgi:hypothetical protein